jgi:nitroreductase
MSREWSQSLESVILGRRTVHAFETAKVSDDLIERAIDVACWAPNHFLTEPWKYYLLSDRPKAQIIDMNYRENLTNKGARFAEVKKNRWQAVPGWLVITSKKSANEKEEQENYAACCCAAQNLMLFLWTKGVGVKWTTGSIIETSDFANIVGFTMSAEKPIGMFWYGYPESIGKQFRQPLKNVLLKV